MKAKLFTEQHPTGLWLVWHEGDQCFADHGEHDTKAKALAWIAEHDLDEFECGELDGK